MPEPTPSRGQLRAELRARRRALTIEQQARAARALVASTAGLPGWRRARHIALYLAADGEIGTAPLAELARTQDKQLFLPVLQPDMRLRFVEWRRGDRLRRNRFGIPEPPADNRQRSARELDIIFMPLVGWDREGGRLGMGGGYYDRTLAAVAGGPLLVGLAHSCQETDTVVGEVWDIPLDFVATESGLHHCNGRRAPG